MVRSAEVELAQLHHDLADDVVARVAVEAQHDKVQGQALGMERKIEGPIADFFSPARDVKNSKVKLSEPHEYEKKIRVFLFRFIHPPLLSVFFL